MMHETGQKLMELCMDITEHLKELLDRGVICQDEFKEHTNLKFEFMKQVKQEP